jgi:CRISPR/Cas system-associated protein endoribonuclease Cas2
MLVKGGCPEFPHESLKAYNEMKYRSDIAHGNIIALHSPAQNRFIRVSNKDVNGRGGYKDIDKLPVEWDSEKFLVVQVAESTFAFYSMLHDEYICMNDDLQVIARTKSQQDDASSDKHHFVVQNVGWGKVTLLSVPQNNFVRMDLMGNIDGNAKVANEWERYSVVLLMKNPHSTP